MILDDIVAARKEQLAREQAKRPFYEVRTKAEGMAGATRDFAGALRADRLAVIAEVKKASPSKGLIQPDFDPVATAKAYEAAGADAVSVLTEEQYFQGSSAYLSAIRKAVSLPLLRKDFIFDPYQIYEARVLGADAVLLIAALLSTEAIREFLAVAKSVGLACLTEVHNEEELERVLSAGCPIVGINNRNLKTFAVDLNVTARLSKSLPADTILVAESGMQKSADLHMVRKQGADAVLIGETLMRSADIRAALSSLREGL